MPEYLRTNLWVDAVNSVESAQTFCARVTLDDLSWKWVLMAVHSAVQGFMALALDRGNALLVMKDRVAEKWLEAHRQATPCPLEQMDFFSLYEKVKTDVVARYVDSRRFIPGPSHDDSMKRLNELRNGFVHFMPKVWAIELAGLPAICLDCLEVARFLAWESGTILWHDEALSRWAQAAMTILCAELKALDGLYNPPS